MEGKSIPVQNHVPEFLSGGGEMGKLIREFDWSKTSLGPVTQWPKSLRTCVQIMLTSRQPYWIGWGKDLIKLYNDPYQAIAGGKHPWALGKPASVVWRDIWKDIGPMLKTVMEENEGIYVESQLLIMERNGYPEETHYTFSYTPVAGDDGGTEGMICANSDDTERILSERQLRTLTELGKAFTEVKSNEDVYQRTIEAVSNNNYDFPFAVLYQLVGTQATVVNSTPLENSKHRVPLSVELPSEGVFAEVFQKALRSGKPQLINAIQDVLGDMPKGAWPIATDKAIVLPIVQRGQKDAFGFFVMGVNPYRLLDEKFTSFFQLVTDQVATSLAGVHAAEEERKRLEALAEIDRAKTTFFSNISHEFRTPLTLLLGPIQDVLNEPDQVDDNRKRMEVALRNVQRMQKLVNLLLDFSKIEAGRLEADFVPVDIVSVTEDLVSNFRSAIEKAGMELIITKEIIEEPVYLDVDMWEKIILNLVSNAFKYSEKGFIEVSIRKEETSVLVAVKDSGIGIPESEIDRVFERFHRVQNVGGRSQEGTGIGLAMVRELVKLQDGSISVQSKVGEGSVFTVSLPLVKKNVKKDKLRIHKPGAQSSVYIEEAVQWLPASSDELIINKSDKRFTILLADDNSDMRKYINRLLAPDYNVIVVTDGEEAFSKAIEAKPDLILSDIMMPKLDGFGLLKKLRNNLSTRSIPVIFLSARAGEEARVEGIKAGADDYLTKPFSSRELLARVGNHIAIASTRTQTEKEFFNLFLQSPAHIHVMKGPEHTFEFFHPLGIAAIGRDITGMKAREALPYMEGQGFFEILDSVYKDGTPAHIKEARALIPDENGEMVEHYFNMTYLPWKDLQANIQGVLQFTFEVTELVQERLKAEANERNLRSIAEQAPVAMTVLKGVDHTVQIVNDLVLQLWGRTYEEVINIPVGKALPEIVAQGIIELLNNVYKTGKPYRANEYPVELDRHGKRETVYLNFMYQPLLTAKKEIEGIIVIATDVTEQVISRRIIEEGEYKLKHAIELADLGTWNINLATNFVDYSPRVAEWWGLPQEGADLNLVIACMHEADRPKVEAAVAHAINESGYYEAEYRLLNYKTGQERYIHANGKVFYDNARIPVRLTGIAQDITLTRTIHQELEKQVRLRTAELVNLNADLVKSNENLRQFAYVASHDLQEPLRKILTYSDLIRSKSKNGLDQPTSEYLDKIALGSQRMSTLIKDLLEFSQTESKDDLYQRVDLNVVMQDIKNDFEIKIQEKQAVVSIDTLPVIQAIPLQMNQLFYNLFGNALKFSKPGVQHHVNITAYPISPEEIEKHNLDRNKKYHAIIMQDNGIGFDAKFSEQIFILFQRLHTRDQYEGTGIGLALCRKIVENHKGLIYAESKEGEGASFTIILPG